MSSDYKYSWTYKQFRSDIRGQIVQKICGTGVCVSNDLDKLTQRCEDMVVLAGIAIEHTPDRGMSGILALFDREQRKMIDHWIL